nr:MAG TPA: hypothetical protein [Caudoviricetes sp.]
MKILLVIMLTALSMTGAGGFIFSIMMLVSAVIIDVYHHKTMIDLRVNRIISEIESACETIKIRVIEK